MSNPAASEPVGLGQKTIEQGAVEADGVRPVVETRGLTKRHGARTVVDALDMQIPAGVVARVSAMPCFSRSAF